jgi:hypothetical protein
MTLLILEMQPTDGLTKFERTWLIKTRAAQLGKSELPMTSTGIDVYDPIEVAEKELEDDMLLEDSTTTKTRPPYRKKQWACLPPSSPPPTNLPNSIMFPDGLTKAPCLKSKLPVSEDKGAVFPQ